MQLKRTLDVTNSHCVKAYICQNDGPYDVPIRVQLSDVEFIMGDIPVVSDKLIFDWDALQEDRMLVLTQNARISHISLMLSNQGASDNYTITVYNTYPDDTVLYPIDTTGKTLTNAAQTSLWLPPANNLVFPSGTAIILNVVESGSGPYNGDITAYIVYAPAVV